MLEFSWLRENTVTPSASSWLKNCEQLEATMASPEQVEEAYAKDMETCRRRVSDCTNLRTCSLASCASLWDLEKLIKYQIIPKYSPLTPVSQNGDLNNSLTSQVLRGSSNYYPGLAHSQSQCPPLARPCMTAAQPQMCMTQLSMTPLHTHEYHHPGPLSHLRPFDGRVLG